MGAASNDNRGFFTMIARARPAPALVSHGPLARPSAPASAARSLLEDCDLVFMSGGDVEHGMKVLHDRDMAGTLRSLARAGKPMFGISAGSLMLAREWVRFHGDGEAPAELFPCLGIAPVHVDAHSEDDGWSELRTLVGLLRARGDRNPVGYGLTRKGGLPSASTRARHRSGPSARPSRASWCAGAGRRGQAAAGRRRLVIGRGSKSGT